MSRVGVHKIYTPRPITLTYQTSLSVANDFDFDGLGDDVFHLCWVYFIYYS